MEAANIANLFNKGCLRLESIVESIGSTVLNSKGDWDCIVKLVNNDKLLHSFGYVKNIKDVSDIRSSFVKLLEMKNSDFGSLIQIILYTRAYYYACRLNETIKNLTKSEVYKIKTNTQGLTKLIDVSKKYVSITPHYSQRTINKFEDLYTRYETRIDPKLFTALRALNKAYNRLKPEIYAQCIKVIQSEITNFLDGGYIDDEANIWWGISTLLKIDTKEISFGNYQGLKGLLDILQLLTIRITNEEIIHPSYEISRLEFTSEIHNDYRTKLFILLNALDIYKTMTSYSQNDPLVLEIKNLLEPFILKEIKKLIYNIKDGYHEHAYFLGLEVICIAESIAFLTQYKENIPENYFTGIKLDDTYSDQENKKDIVEEIHVAKEEVIERMNSRFDDVDEKLTKILNQTPDRIAEAVRKAINSNKIPDKRTKNKLEKHLNTFEKITDISMKMEYWGNKISNYAPAVIALIANLL